MTRKINWYTRCEVTVYTDIYNKNSYKSTPMTAHGKYGKTPLFFHTLRRLHLKMRRKIYGPRICSVGTLITSVTLVLCLLSVTYMAFLPLPKDTLNWKPSSVLGTSWKLTDMRCPVKTWDQLEKEKILNKKKETQKLILWHNPSEDHSDFQTHFDFRVCKTDNCALTTDEAAVRNSDAIIFDIDNLKDVHPPLGPSDRPDHQVWIAYSRKSPIYLDSRVHSLPQWVGVFNWTMTYETHSDIPFPFGSISTRTVSKVKTRNYTNIFQRKHKMAVIIMNKCGTSSKRDDYLDLLSKYIPVDVYGQCGNNNCGHVGLASSGTRHDKCAQMVFKDYKFYLAFEHSLCSDYATEELYKYLLEDVVVVARGALNYNKLFPPGLFINTESFASPKKLAKYLNWLGTSEKGYTRYLQNQDLYRKNKELETYRCAICNVCERLHDVQRYKKTYRDISDWFNGLWNSNNCTAARDLVDNEL